MSRKRLIFTTLSVSLVVLGSAIAQQLATERTQPPAPAETSSAAPPVQPLPTAPPAASSQPPSALNPVSDPTAPATVRRTDVITLKYSRSQDALVILRDLLKNDDFETLSLAEDSRTNTIILRGSPEEIESVRKLIAQLDQQVAATNQSAGTGLPAYPTYPSARDSRPMVTATAQRQLPARSQPFGIAGFGREAPSPQMLESMRLDEQAAQIAKEYRSAAGAATPDEKQLSVLRERLKKIVNEAFDKRQELQGAEINKMKDRLAKVENTLSKRTEHRQQIVDNRVQELLDENQDLRWDPTVATRLAEVGPRGATVIEERIGPDFELRRLPARSHQGATVIEERIGPDGVKYQVPRYVMPQPVGVPSPLSLPGPPVVPAAPSAASPPGFAPGSAGTNPVPGGTSFLPTQPSAGEPTAGSSSRALRFPAAGFPGSGTEDSASGSPLSAIRRDLMESQSELAEATLRLDETDSIAAKGLVTPSQAQLAKERVRRAEQRIEFARRELEAQLKLLELDLQAAQVRFEAVSAALNSAKAQHDAGQTTDRELAKLSAEKLLAALEMKRAQTLLDLYRNVPSESPTKNETAQPKDDKKSKR